MIWSKILPTEVEATLAAAARGGPPVWLVGGAVRDHFLERSTVDFDFAVAGDGRRLARRVADRLDGDYFALDPERGTGRVLAGPEESAWRTLDFARLRGDDLEEDLAGRDFTVNAMAVSASEEQLIDPTGGLPDLKDRWLRLCQPHGLADDPIRTLRAVRLAADLGFRLDPALIAAIPEAAPRLGASSVERRRDELFRILKSDQPVRALRVSHQLGLLELTLPELSSERVEAGLRLLARLTDLMGAIVGRHDEAATAELYLGQASLRLGRFRLELDRAMAEEVSVGRERRALLALVALFLGGVCQEDMDLGEALVPAAERLRLSREEIAHVRGIVGWAGGSGVGLPLPEPTDLARYRFFRELGKAGVEAVLLSLSCWLVRAMGGPDQEEWAQEVETARQYLKAYFEGPRQALAPDPIVRGDDLIAALDLEPGPVVGRLLEAIREAQVTGEITRREEALALAANRLEASGWGAEEDQG